MADPVTAMAVVGMGASAGGGIMGALGSMFGGQAQSNMYTYQAGVAKINKQIAEQNADYAKQAGEVEAQTSGLKTRFQIGATKATQAASGLDVNAGSAKDVRESEAEVGEYDQALIRSNAAKRAYGYEVEATGHEAQAGLDVMAASTSKTAGDIGAISSLLGGASSVASKWTQYKTSFGSGG